MRFFHSALLTLLAACGTDKGDAPATSMSSGSDLGPAPAAPASLGAEEAPGCLTTPTLAGIPEGGAAGEIDGKPFQARAIVFELGLTGWVLRIHDTAIAEATSLVSTGQQIEVRLPTEPSNGWTDVRALGVGEGYWTATQVQNTAARRGTDAWALEVTRWNVRPWVDGGGLIQDLGRASGRLSVVLHGDSGRCAWVAGRFEGATVRQVGRLAAPVPPSPAAHGEAESPADDASPQGRVRQERALFDRRNRIKKGREALGY